MNAPADPWFGARSLPDLGGLCADWLEGSIAEMPGYFGPGPDPESEPLLGVLAKLNRVGYFTEQSQPGEIDGSWRQRAFVSGWAEPELVGAFMSVLDPTELVIVATPPSETRITTQIVVTLDDARENTWLGAAHSTGDLRGMYGPHLSPDALEALCSAWQLQIFDPVWGRKDELWTILEAIADVLS